MVFSSATFLLVFLPIVFAANCIAGKKSNAVLLIASLLFYAWGEPHLIFLMMTSIVVNWLLGIAISKTNNFLQKIIFVLGVVCNLGVLCYYKYADFFVSIINNIANKEMISKPGISLPIGISFFTFQAISYIADVYRGETDASESLLNVALYISFFPQLVAGPIVKYKDINKQIESRDVTFSGVTLGCRRFIYGLAKKVLIANVLASCVDFIWGGSTT